MKKFQNLINFFGQFPQQNCFVKNFVLQKFAFMRNFQKIFALLDSFHPN